MNDLSKDSVRSFFRRRDDAKKQEPPRNSLREMRNQVYGGDTSMAAYKAYVIEAQTNGEQAMPFDQWRQSKQPKNSLAK